MTALTVGVDIGGTKIAVGAVDGNGHPVGDTLTASTPAKDGADAILGEVSRLIGVVRALHPTIVGIGIGSAGVFDQEGVVSSATDILSGWMGTPVGARVADATGLPVVTVNDVNAIAVGEHFVGAAVGFENVLVVAVGTGVGGAFLQNGALVRGRAGVAGSIGHTVSSAAERRRCSCGQPDHVEPHASGPGIELTYYQASGQKASLREISAAADNGDHAATDAIRLGATSMGAAIASAINMLDPELVLVGGGVAQVGDVYFDALRASVASRALAPVAEIDILPAALGTRAAIIGAGMLAHRLARPSYDR
jgi:glucokinase